ncbi:MAG TPA: DUF455 family protein [Planctomycetota bacterium]|nr:DUF455 family protein [Planctomycetota bacterium]
MSTPAAVAAETGSAATFATPANGWSVFAMADRMRRAAYIEKAALRALTGWFVTTPAYETKYAFGAHVWDHAEHVTWLRERLQNLRGGHPDANVEPGFRLAVDRALHAPTPHAFVAGLYLELQSALIEFLRATLNGCDHAANAADIKPLRRILPELEAQQDWARQYLLGDPTPALSTAWRKHLRQLIDAAGGIDGQGPRQVLTRADETPATPFALPGRITFDHRISEQPLTPHNEKLKLPYTDALREQFKVFFNEVYAAAMLSAILFDSFNQEVPWEFVHDFSRHFWDECRHSEFGATRLKELGTAPDRCNQLLFGYAMQMPFLHRLCYLTMVLEAFYMPRKKPRFEEYGNAGDLRSQLYADHDWSDEANHVRWGKKHLTALMEEDARDIDTLKQEIMAILERVTGKKVESLSPF